MYNIQFNYPFTQLFFRLSPFQPNIPFNIILYSFPHYIPAPFSFNSILLFLYKSYSILSSALLYPPLLNSSSFILLWGSDLLILHTLPASLPISLPLPPPPPPTGFSLVPTPPPPLSPVLQDSQLAFRIM